MLKSFKSVEAEKEATFRFNFVDETTKKKKKKKSKGSLNKEENIKEDLLPEEEVIKKVVPIQQGTSQIELQSTHQEPSQMPQLHQITVVVEPELPAPVVLSAPIEILSEAKSNSKIKPKKKKKLKDSATKPADDDDDFLDAMIQEAKFAEEELAKTAALEAKEKAKKDPSSIRFKSHKDPELSEAEARVRRFGNGVNLTAIGPPRRRSNWLPTSALDAGNGGSICDVSEMEGPLHTSPFSFGFR